MLLEELAEVEEGKAMGGSGSIGMRSPVGLDTSGSDPCDLRFKTNLFAPVASVVQELSVGDCLTVKLITQGQSQSVATLTQSTGAIAGTITGVHQLGVLVNCLTQYAYEAEVKEISGSQVTIVVKRV